MSNRKPLVREGTHHSRPSLTIKRTEDDEHPISFGVGKAKMLLAAMAEIKAFVDRHTGKGAKK